MFVSVCAALRLVNLVEHELAGDDRLGAVHIAGATLERRHHLLHHLVEEDVSELGVEEGAKLKGDREIHCAGARISWEAGAETPNCLQVVEQFTI